MHKEKTKITFTITSKMTIDMKQILVLNRFGYLFTHAFLSNIGRYRFISHVTQVNANSTNCI